MSSALNQPARATAWLVGFEIRSSRPCGKGEWVWKGEGVSPKFPRIALHPPPPPPPPPGILQYCCFQPVRSEPAFPKWLCPCQVKTKCLYQNETVPSLIWVLFLLYHCWNRAHGSCTSVACERVMVRGL